MSSSPLQSSNFGSSFSPSASSASYMLATGLNSLSDQDEVESLPSVSASDSSLEGDFSDGDEESDAEREWKESIQQLELLLTMVIIPFVGKYLGRKCAYWGWARMMEWKYPVEIVVQNKAVARSAGVTKAAAPL
ncbi:predicted protein [Histoplasma capsulatum G186AR]|uniref:Uncharacterized protein n=2 Tax=Ajellomyces capsulatus TaxID=5037 RepID=C0NAT2_AJECG|nr:uncharacterized protein HCBG_00228 [Histoplasma capsulatum G186AR]EEH10773.1 predicted protein [Histoplasma capsulatum G186AR]KAG5288654.1 hypothetical protein I7I52_12204 [Histoplasma capsulatum]QSS71229.1 hypothetical protein I7I50_01990 [Histoplasma capsulatum G186AR]